MSTLRSYSLSYSLLLAAFFLAGCASLQLGGEFQAGRQALLKGNDDAALGYFQSVAQKDPNYIYGSAYPQGILSYLGRAEYSTGQLPQARQTLERALSAGGERDVARLYLGLTLMRAGDRVQGLKEVTGAMKGIHDWIDYVSEAQRFSYGQFWDPGHDLRSAIESQLAMISKQETPDTQKVIADGEWLGKRMEEEIDRARRQESEDRNRDSDSSGDTQP